MSADSGENNPIYLSLDYIRKITRIQTLIKKADDEVTTAIARVMFIAIHKITHVGLLYD